MNGVEFQAGTYQISMIRGDKASSVEIRWNEWERGSRHKQNLIAAYTRGLLRIAICQEVGGQIRRAVSNRVYSRLSLDTRIFRKSRSNAVYNFPLGFRISSMDPADYHPSIGFLRIATPFPSDDRWMDAIRPAFSCRVIRFITFSPKCDLLNENENLSLFLRPNCDESFFSTKKFLIFGILLASFDQPRD